MSDEVVKVRRIEQFKGTVAELMDRLVASQLAPSAVTISATHLVWFSERSPEEQASYDEYTRRNAERTAEWERKTYERLRAKFVPVAVDPTTPKDGENVDHA